MNKVYTTISKVQLKTILTRQLKLVDENLELRKDIEFSDFMYFRTDIDQNKSKLKFNVSSIANTYFNRNVPHIIVFGDNNLNYLNYKAYNNYAVVKISPNPYLILNNLNLSETDLLDIFKFIKLNKKNFNEILELEI